MRFLDNRGLAPPEPMVRVLQELENLGEREELRVLNDRRPIFLYPILAERGYRCDTRELAEDCVELRICKQTD